VRGLELSDKSPELIFSVDRAHLHAAFLPNVKNDPRQRRQRARTARDMHEASIE
jgi:hypothetical protein